MDRHVRDHTGVSRECSSASHRGAVRLIAFPFQARCCGCGLGNSNRWFARQQICANSPSGGQMPASMVGIVPRVSGNCWDFSCAANHTWNAGQRRCVANPPAPLPPPACPAGTNRTNTGGHSTVSGCNCPVGQQWNTATNSCVSPTPTTPPPPPEPPPPPPPPPACTGIQGRVGGTGNCIDCRNITNHDGSYWQWLDEGARICFRCTENVQYFNTATLTCRPLHFLGRAPMEQCVNANGLRECLRRWSVEFTGSTGNEGWQLVGILQAAAETAPAPQPQPVTCTCVACADTAWANSQNTRQTRNINRSCVQAAGAGNCACTAGTAQHRCRANFIGSQTQANNDTCTPCPTGGTAPAGVGQTCTLLQAQLLCVSPQVLNAAGTACINPPSVGGGWSPGSNAIANDSLATHDQGFQSQYFMAEQMRSAIPQRQQAVRSAVPVPARSATPVPARSAVPAVSRQPTARQ